MSTRVVHIILCIIHVYVCVSAYLASPCHIQFIHSPCQPQCLVITLLLLHFITMKIGFQAKLNNLAVGVPHSSTWQCRFLASSLCGSPYQFLDSPCQLQILASPCQPRSITLSVLGASAAVPGLSMPASVCGHHYISLCQLPFQQIGFQAKLNNLAWQCGLLSLCPFLVQFIANPYQCTVSAADHISSWSHCATYST